MKYLSIPHYRGLKEKYDEQKYGDGIFFTTDTHEIIANNATYGETINTWSIDDGVLTLTMTSGKTLEITFDEATESVKGFLSAEDKKKINSLEENFDKKVDKVPGKSLVDDTDIAKLAELPSNSDLNNKLDTKLDKSAVESTVTADSNNPVSSAAIATYVSNTVTAIENNVTNGTWIPVRKGSGDYSIIVGGTNTATNDYSYAEGDQTSSSGHACHAEGYHTSAAAQSSHAEGGYTEINCDYSHAEGYCTKFGDELAKGVHVQGIANYHTGGDNIIHDVGIGTVTQGDNGPIANRLSAETIVHTNTEQNGYKYLIGVGGYQGREIGDAKSVQEVFADLEDNKVDKTDIAIITDDEIDEMFNK